MANTFEEFKGAPKKEKWSIGRFIQISKIKKPNLYFFPYPSFSSGKTENSLEGAIIFLKQVKGQS